MTKDEYKTLIDLTVEHIEWLTFFMNEMLMSVIISMQKFMVLKLAKAMQQRGIEGQKALDQGW